MAQILIRNLSDETVRAIKARAASHGRSMEAEMRHVLESTFSPKAEYDVEKVRQKLRRVRKKYAHLFKGDDTTAILREIRDEN